MLTRAIIDGVTYYVKINLPLPTECKLIEIALWIGQFSINVKRGFKSLLLIPYDGSELVYYRTYVGVDYYSFVKVSMAVIMRSRRRAILELLTAVLLKRVSSPFINLNSKITSATKKLLWTGRLTISSLSRTDSLALLKLNKAIEFCKFSLKVNRELLKVNDPFKLFRANRLISSFAYHFAISPETLLFNLKLLTPKTFEVLDVNIIKIKHFYIQTIALKTFTKLGSTSLQLLRHNWLLTIRRLENIQQFNFNRSSLLIQSSNFWTIFYRILLRSFVLPFALLNNSSLLEWRNNLTLNLNFVNYAISFYKFSNERLTIVPFALVILNKIKSLTFLFLPYTSVIARTSLMPIKLSLSQNIEMKIRLKPLFNRVIITPDDTIKVTKGGIILPETTADNITMGTICEVSDEVYVKVGDRVLYNRNVALKYSLNGNVIDILEVIDLLAIIYND
ncbi:MAG: GroES family chaperonin [Candidatus Hodgkinia cicadicola]